MLGHYNTGPKTLAGKSENALYLYTKLSLIKVIDITISFISDNFYFINFWFFITLSSFLGKLFLTGIIISTYLLSFTNIFQTNNQFENVIVS